MMEKDEDFWPPFTARSEGMRSVLARMDYAFLDREEMIRELEVERDMWREKATKAVNASINASQQMIGQTLVACLGGVPKAENIGPVAAVMIDRIRSMQTIEEVQAYIEGIVNDVKEKENSENSQCKETST